MLGRTLAALLTTLPLLAAAAEPLTLDAALAEAERASPDLAAARARLEQARAAVAKARSGYLPQLKAGATTTRNSEESVVRLPTAFAVRDTGAPTTAPGGGLPGAPTTLVAVPSQVVEATVQARDQLAAQLELSQAILAPPLWYAIEGAGLGARAAGESLEAARRELRFGVAQAFYGASAAAQAVLVQERQLAVTQAHERDAAVQVEAGVQPRIALLRARIDRARAEQDLVRARNAVAAAKSTLAALLGRADALDAELAAPPAPALPADVSGLEDDALRLRPDLAAARTAVEAAGAGRRAATARYLPTLGAFGQARWANAGGFTGSNETWAAGLALSWTLLDGGLREAERREAGARIAEAEAARDAAANRARDEVRRARLDLDSARANRAKAEEQAQLARENQRLVEAAFRAGASSSLEAADANAALATAEIGRVNEGLAADLAALRLLRAAGRYGAP